MLPNHVFLFKRMQQITRMNQTLIEEIQEVCDKCNISGRLVMESNGSVTVFDCSEWTSKVIQLLRFRNPNIHFEVYESTMSLSGFIIVFTDRKHKNGIMRCMYCVGSALLLYFLIFHQRTFFLE